MLVFMVTQYNQLNSYAHCTAKKWQKRAFFRLHAVSPKGVLHLPNFILLNYECAVAKLCENDCKYAHLKREIEKERKNCENQFSY